MSQLLSVHAPFDRSLITTLPLGDQNTAEQALATAHGLFLDRKVRLPIWRRREILEKAASLVAERRESLAEAASREGGKPLIDSRVEIERARLGILEAAQSIAQLTGHEIPMGLTPSSEHRRAFTTCEPIGPVLAISAFNHPFNLLVHQAITAVAVGCPVIIKPALTTPMSCQNLIQILREAGLPEGWCQMILVSDVIAESMAADPRVAFLSFIGSAKVGWSLRQKIAPGTRCALEHGGVAPVILDASAQLDQALPLIAKGGFYHAGQVCVSVQRVFVHESLWDETCKKISALATALKVGDPLDSKTEVGPLIRPSEVQRIQEWISEAVGGGAQVLCGGNPLSATTFAPTCLLNPPITSRVSRQEIFGPVICLYRYRELDEALTQANSVPYSFQAAVFTQDLDVAIACTERLNATTVLVNDHTAFRVDWMPFGGQKLSGLGVGGILPTMRDLTFEKMMILKSKNL